MEVLPAAPVAAPLVAPAGRFYKSRKARPCDACRRRKVTCNMPAGPPCHYCHGKTQPCTFEHGPGLRKRPTPARPGSAVLSAPPGASTIPLSPANQSSTWLVDPAFFSWPPGALDFSAASFADGPGAQLLESAATGPGKHDTPPQPPDLRTPSLFGSQRLPSFSSVVPPRSPSLPRLLPRPQTATSSLAAASSVAASAPAASASSAAAVSRKPLSRTPEPFTTDGSLEILPGVFSFYVGPTGVADVHLLNRGPFGRGDVSRPSVKGLQYRRMRQQRRAHHSAPSAPASREATPPAIFGLTDHALLDKAEPKPDAEATESAWVALWQILDSSTAWSLIQLYTRFVDPYFPILSRHQMPSDPDTLSNMSLALLTAVCATALPFVVYDRSLYALLLRPPSSEQLYRLCWLGIEQELHAPSLSTLQACLLLQQRLPTNLYLHDTAFSWSLMATAVSVAQTIGLHRDPTAWTSVPAWERRLRRRLWWSLWAMEKWVALARGMPSHLHDDEADVEPLRADDMDETLSPPAEAARPHLFHLVGLTSILAEIQRAFYTLRATRQTAHNLAASFEAGRSARVRLCDWRDQLPASLRFRQRQMAMAQNQAHAQGGAADNSDGGSGSGEGRGDTEGPETGSRGGSDGTSRGAVSGTAHAYSPSRGDDGQRLDGNASLHLSYIVTHMTLFRALLRPLERDQEAEDGGHANVHAQVPHEPSTQAVTHGALLCVREFVEFVEALTPAQWNAFWHGWSRANFAIAGSFLVLLLHVVSIPVTDRGQDDMGSAGAAAGTAEAGSRHAGANEEIDAASTARPGFESEYCQLLGWIKRWRWAASVSANGAGAKGLTNLGLLRVESFLGQFGELEEI